MSQDGQPPLRVVFMGTPDFALPSLRRLLETQRVVGVLCQPDRPAGRGRDVRPGPVSALAREAGLPLLQPRSLRRGAEAADARRALAELRPDILVVAAYGLILPREVLEAGPLGALNVHASLLPRWRGAAPIQHALLAGDEETGVTIMKMDEGLDTGPILRRRAIPVAPDETGGSLFARLAPLGAELLVETLPAWAAGEIVPEPQDERRATLAPRLSRRDGEVDWRRPAAEIERRARALAPWPGSFSHGRDGARLKLHRLRLPEPGEAPDDPAEPGAVRSDAGRAWVRAGDGWLELVEVQPSGRGRMSGAAYLRGRGGRDELRLAPSAGTSPARGPADPAAS